MKYEKLYLDSAGDDIHYLLQLLDFIISNLNLVKLVIKSAVLPVQNFSSYLRTHA